MEMIYLDESGYCFDWKTNHEEQPYYVLSAVCISADKLDGCSMQLRQEVADLKVPGANPPLGRGFEIKAKLIEQGSGHWNKNPVDRQKIRKAMLTTASTFGARSILVVVDKPLLLSTYRDYARDPYLLAYTMMLERIQKFLERNGQLGVIVYDHNQRIATELNNTAADLATNGSNIQYLDFYTNLPSTTQLKIDRIVEFTFSDSKYSVGLQIADYFATRTSSLMKKGHAFNDVHWGEFWHCLDSVSQKVKGIGIKVYPERETWKLVPPLQHPHAAPVEPQVAEVLPIIINITPAFIMAEDNELPWTEVQREPDPWEAAHAAAEEEERIFHEAMDAYHSAKEEESETYLAYQEYLEEEAARWASIDEAIAQQFDGPDF
ncbi:MAG: DUF3800 domain-containing protein [Candidatus Sumerlaeaceae bacterium]